MNNLRQIRNIIYNLKRNYGVPITIIYAESTTHNLQTGEITIEEEAIKVRRAIVITPRQIRDFSYDLAFIAASKNFTYGGYYDTSARLMIIDAKDLPSDYEPNLNHRCVYDNRRYEFEELNSTTGRTAYMIKMRQLDAAKVENVIPESVSNNMPLEQEES